MKYSEIIYIINDLCKQFSDDTSITEDHILFLLSKYRSQVLYQLSIQKKKLSNTNYQIICLDLEPVDGVPCITNAKLRSVQKIPNLLPTIKPYVYFDDFYISETNYVSKERMKYVGNNNILKNQIYCSIAPDKHLYFKSCNPQMMYIQKAKMSAIFEDIDEAMKLDCGENKCVDLMDQEFPMDQALIPNVIQLVLKDILGASYRPIDNANNAKDDLATLATFLRNNAKSDLAKQIEGIE